MGNLSLSEGIRVSIGLTGGHGKPKGGEFVGIKDCMEEQGLVLNSSRFLTNILLLGNFFPFLRLIITLTREGTPQSHQHTVPRNLAKNTKLGIV